MKKLQALKNFPDTVFDFLFVNHKGVTAGLAALSVGALGTLVYLENTQTDWLGHPDTPQAEEAKQKFNDTWNTATPEQKVRYQFIDPLTIHAESKGVGFLGVITPSDKGSRGDVTVAGSSTCFEGTLYQYADANENNDMITVDPVSADAPKLLFRDTDNHLVAANDITAGKLTLLGCDIVQP